MRPSDASEFGAMLTAIAGLYGRDVSPAVTALYWGALQMFDLAAVRQAFDRHVKNPDAGMFMPKPADLIRMLQGSTQDAAFAAWTKVEKAIRRVGGHDDVVFDDALIHAVIDDMGGWVKLCDVKEDELPFRAKEFENRYRGYAQRREVPSYEPVLIGRANTHNAKGGYRLSPPALVGDAETCKQVMRLAQGKADQITWTRPTLMLETA